jgi:predicted metal-dependent HD superfamily phosphohydrolase
MVDIDLSILGAAPPRFDEYERQIRREYDWVTPEAFAAGRISVLEGFLARPPIFTTEFFHGQFEQQARANLARSISRLASHLPTLPRDIL